MRPVRVITKPYRKAVCHEMRYVAANGANVCLNWARQTHFVAVNTGSDTSVRYLASVKL